MMQPCPLDRCDGSGMVDVYFLKTITRNANGSVFTKKEKITREQYKVLERKVDWKDQEVLTAAQPCGCKSAA